MYSIWYPKCIENKTDLKCISIDFSKIAPNLTDQKTGQKNTAVLKKEMLQVSLPFQLLLDHFTNCTDSLCGPSHRNSTNAEGVGGGGALSVDSFSHKVHNA
jgi:hypothetical protein